MTRKRRSTKSAPKKGERTRPAWIKTFLAALAIAANISEACDAAGIDRATFYKRRNSDPVFLAAARQAIGKARDSLEREVWRRAAEGVNEPVIHQGEMSGIWVDDQGNIVTKDTTGARLIPLTVKKYSDTLAIFLLKAHKPKKFRERQEVEHKGKVKHAHTVEHLTDEELEAIARGGGKGSPKPPARPPQP